MTLFRRSISARCRSSYVHFGSCRAGEDGGHGGRTRSTGRGNLSPKLQIQGYQRLLKLVGQSKSISESDRRSRLRDRARLYRHRRAGWRSRGYQFQCVVARASVGQTASSPIKAVFFSGQDMGSAGVVYFRCPILNPSTRRPGPPGIQCADRDLPLAAAWRSRSSSPPGLPHTGQDRTCWTWWAHEFEPTRSRQRKRPPTNSPVASGRLGQMSARRRVSRCAFAAYRSFIRIWKTPCSSSIVNCLVFASGSGSPGRDRAIFPGN